MIEFYFKVSNARPDQQKPRLRLGFAKVGRTSPCPLQKLGYSGLELFGKQWMGSFTPPAL